MNSEFWTWFEDYVVPKLATSEKKMDRTNTFRKMFKHLDRFESPIIVETGCTGPIEDLPWIGSGCSTILFDKYVSLNGGRFYSVDTDQGAVDKIKTLMGENSTVYCNDSVDFLKNFVESGVEPNLVYLDASHLYWHIATESQVHHFNELKAIMPRLTPQTLVVVDDTPAIMDEQTDYEVRGKGVLVAKYASELGVPLVFSEYQSGWLGFPGFPQEDNDSNEEMIGRARKLMEEGEWANAYPIYKQILARTYNFNKSGRQRIMHGEACAFFARLAVAKNRLGAAFDWYRRALKADPRAVDYRIEFVNGVLIPMNVLPTARSEAERATRIEPDNPFTWRILGKAEAAIGDAKRSLVAHRKQVEIDNRSLLSLLDTIGILIDNEEYEEAESLCAELSRSNDDRVKGDVLHYRAVLEARYGNHEKAIELYKQALDKGCKDESLINFHMSLSLHSIGKYKEGFEALAERAHNRTNLVLFVPMQRFTRPLFEMQPPPALIHIHAESGDGDNICLMRYLPLLMAKGYTVRYEARANFLKLASDSLKGIEVTPQALDYPGALGVKDFDYHLPIGEIMYQFGTDIDTVPWYGPYIKADPILVKKYERYKGKIGIAWSAGVRETEGIWTRRYGQLKSLSYDLISPIIRNNPEKFVSLQVGLPRLENLSIEYVLPEDPNWSDTAALIENLDLVITPDTGLAHLAGAMGKPTWIMMHGYNSGWHFMCERPGAPWNEKSPWYPSVRLFRQKTPGDWKSVIDSIVKELKQQQQKAA